MGKCFIVKKFSDFIYFNVANRRENIHSGDSLEILFSKISKYLEDLKDIAFSGNANDLKQDPFHRLVSDNEKNSWNQITELKQNIERFNNITISNEALILSDTTKLTVTNEVLIIPNF